MQRLLRLVLPLMLACFAYLCSTAKPTDCSADFTYLVGANKTVTFIAKDTLGATHRWWFGDGATLETAAGVTVHIYGQPGQYEVRHVVKRPNANCNDTIVKIITIPTDSNNCNTTAKYAWRKDSLDCKKVWFVNLSTPISPNVHFIWKFGDGTTSNDVSPAHIYNQPGKYYVCLVSEVVNGNCRKEYCDSVIVKCDTIPVPCNITAKYEYRRDSLDCKKIRFINLSTFNTPVQYIWKFGDGTTSNDFNPTHVYSQPGKYYVCLVVEGTGTNCRKEYCDTVKVNCDVNPCNITAKYTYRRDSLDCKKVWFVNLSTPVSPNVHFVWKFGDGGTSNDVSPTHVYSQPGKYYVCLVSEAGTNCRKEYCDSVIVNCETPCNLQPNFAWRADTLTPSKVYFQNLTLSGVAGVHYSWKFGDGTASNDINPIHVYGQPGKYNVCLVAEISNTCRREICKQIEVAAACNVFAKFVSRRDSLQWNNVWFSNLSQPVGNIRQTYWYYGDGATSQDFNTLHKYDKPGVYMVCLKVVSLNGCISSYCDSVRVVKPDSCVITGRFGHHLLGTSPLSIRFEALYNSSTAKYKWSFGDSTVADGRIVSHRYQQAGKYSVCLTITDGACKITSCETITVGLIAGVGGRVGQASAWPNPAMSTVSLDVPLERAEQVHIRFLDGNGAVLREFNKTGAMGNNRFALPVDGLSQGLYLVEIRTNTRKWFSRFQKG